eukprot:616495-Karenia_brevis.AAC.1
MIKEMENKFREVRRPPRREKKVKFNQHVCREGCGGQGGCQDRWVCPVEAQGKKMSINFQVAAVSKPLLA